MSPPEPNYPGRPPNLVHLPLLQTHLRKRAEDRGPSEEGPEADNLNRRALEADLERLPYCLNGCFDATEQLGARFREVAASQRLAPLPSQGHNYTLLLTPEDTYPLAYAVDAFLDAARRAQNAIVPYLTRTLRTSLPASLAGLAESSGRRSLTEPLDEIIKNYWTASGKLLKDYRDLAQHHAVASTEARIVVRHGSAALIYLALPNNPAAKKLTELAYRDPVVLAHPYCVTAFIALFAFAYDVTYYLCRILGPLKTLTHVVIPKDYLDAGGSPGHVVPTEGEVAQLLREARAGLREANVARYGRLEDPAIAAEP